MAYGVQTDEQFKIVQEFHLFGRGVCGLAHVDGRLFVVEELSDRIRVYDDGYPSRSRPAIHVPGLQDPRDLVAAALPSSSCLFVLDACERDGGTVWRLRLKMTPEKEDYEIEQYIRLHSNAAGSLSVTHNGRLVATNFSTNKLEVIKREISAETAAAAATAEMVHNRNVLRGLTENYAKSG